MFAKNIKRTLQHSFTLVFSFTCIFLFSQNEKGVYPVTNSATPFTGKTYAVIIGISHYQSSKLPQLEYADKDARAFSDFLISPAGGNTDSSDIKLLLNENAKCANIWAAIGWLGRVAQKGDKVFIYFSGHGDAIDERESFLLAYDAPGQDPNLYLAGGVIQIYNLKNRIHDLVNAKGAQVLFITDACRTNEIPGGQNGSGYAFKKIMEDNQGEIQFNSCSANEASQEGIQWGNGRGVFSWYLINGMMGLADEDGDGIVTLYELQNYVSANVRKETKSSSTGKPKQSPAFCCTDKNDLAISLVNKDEKKKALLALGKTSEPTNALASKGLFSFSDPIIQKIYENFLDSIATKNFLNDDPVQYETFANKDKDTCAWFYLDLLRNSKEVSEERKYDLMDIYISAVMNHVQEQINQQLNGQIKSESACSSEIHSVLMIAKLPDDEMKTIKGNYYFFKGWETSSYHDYDYLNFALAYCDSALQCIPKGAYIYNIQGIIYQGLTNYSEAKKCFTTAMELAPNWTFPIGNLGHNYSLLGDDSTSLVLYAQILKLDSTLWPAYLNVGTIYYEKWKKSGNEKDRQNGIANYQKAIFYDSTYAESYTSLALFYKADSLQQYRKYLIQKAYQLAPQNAKALGSMGEYYYQEKDYENAVKYFRAYCYDYPTDSYGLYYAGLCYFNLSKADSALLFFKYEEKTDPNGLDLKYYLGKTYILKGQNRKAVHYFLEDIKFNPGKAANSYYELSTIYSKKILGKRKSKKYMLEYNKLNGK